MLPFLTQLPGGASLVLASIVLALVALFGLSKILAFLRDLRTNLANELRTELAKEAKPSPVAVQQPLEIKAHQTAVTREEHQKLEARMLEELGRERGARKKIHEEIGQLQTEAAVLRKESEHQTRQLTTLDGKIDQVLMRLPRFS